MSFPGLTCSNRRAVKKNALHFLGSSYKNARNNWLFRGIYTGGLMKKIILIASLLLATVLFTSCVVLPDGKGGTYTYALGDDEIEYKNPDGSKTIVNQDGTVTHKR